MHQFNERHPKFEGFSEFYEKDLRPFHVRTATRKWPLDRFGTTMSGIASFSVCWAFLVYVFQLPLILALLFSAGVFVLSFIIYDMTKFSGAIKPDFSLISKVAAFIGFYAAADTASPLLVWRALGLLPSYKNRDVILLNVEGKHKGSIVQFLQVTTYAAMNNSGSKRASDQLVFDGHLIRFDMPKSFSGTTVIRRDGGGGQAKVSYGLKRVGLVDPIFEKIFEVYGSDQVEARALLTPDLMQEIIDLERVTRGKLIEFGFISGQLLISLSKPIVDIRDALDGGIYDIVATQNIIDEMSCILDIADTIIR